MPRLGLRPLAREVVIVNILCNSVYITYYIFISSNMLIKRRLQKLVPWELLMSDVL